MSEIKFDEDNDSGYTIQKLVIDVVGRPVIASAVTPSITRGAVAHWYAESRIPPAHKSTVCSLARSKGLLITPEIL